MTELSLSDSSAKIQRHALFPSKYITPRNVDVWYPADYQKTTGRLPVIYMHDGQNLFDPALAYIGVDWGVDEAITSLIHDQKTPGAIVVGIWNSPQRCAEYMPQKAFIRPDGRFYIRRFIKEFGTPPFSDRYLRFLVEELKPFIDANYRTLADPQHTFIMGSSMGGLISLYALVEYPQVFGGAGCLSTHWPIGENILLDYFRKTITPAGSHKLYFDFGTEGLDSEYETYQQRMDAIVKAAGYQLGIDWLTQKFEGAEHSEKAWRGRLQIPLKFLLTG